MKNKNSNLHSEKIRKQDFRLFLHEELANRCTNNPKYSLRAFAKFLNESPSALSAMIKGKRPISHKIKTRIGLKLGLSLEDLDKFYSTPHGNIKRKNNFNEQANFKQIAIDSFAIIASPYYYALLELIKTKDFVWDTKWISKRLNLTPSEVNIALERLERVGILERDKNGNLFDSTKGFSTDIREGLSSQAQRCFQQRSLEQAINAIQTVPIELRNNTSMTMAVDIHDIPKAKQMIKDFRRQFCMQMEQNQNPNEVYQLTISFVPVTNNVKGDNK